MPFAVTERTQPALRDSLYLPQKGRGIPFSTMARLGEMMVHQAVVMMLLLWPRVGEVEVDGLQGCFRNQVIQKIGCFDSKQSDVAASG